MFTDQREARRLVILRRLGLVSSGNEQAFDDIVRVAATLMHAPCAGITLVDDVNVRFKSATGFDGHEVERAGSPCDLTIRSTQPVVIEDLTSDPRFASWPLLGGPGGVRSYVGVPVQVAGARLGALVVMDRVPRHVEEHELEALVALGRQVERVFELRFRRSLATVPSRLHVEDLATRLTAGADFDRLLRHEMRPAWLVERATLKFIEVNQSAIEQYGWSREQFLEMTLDDVRPPAEVAILRSVMDNGTDFHGTRHWRHQRADGSTFAVQVVTGDAWVDDRAVRLAVITDLSTRMHGSEALHRAATHDALTGLPNRSMFYESLSTASQQAPQDSMAVLFIDLDGFKRVNDTAGHATGDALLAGTAARIAAGVREDDVFARLGGDEFAIFCRGAGEIEAYATASRIARLFDEPLRLGAREYFLSACIGIAVGTGDQTGERLVSDADLAMLEAKRMGRGCIATFDEHLRTEVARRATIEHDLHQAILREEFELYYQPIVEIDGPAIHFEALIRWHHPERGLLRPAEFLDIAGEVGLLGPINSWVLREVAAMTERLATTESWVRIAFNLPAANLNSAFVAEVERVMEDAQLDPARLFVEVTETAFAASVDASVAAQHLRDLGIGVSIDDFGTGYSSLDRLRTLRVDALKLDQTFVRQIHTAQGRGMVAAVVQLARALDLPIVAEGVETPEQLEAVRDLGCRYVQGYLVGRPGPAAQALEFLENNSAVSPLR